ncbi:Hsp20/alpha crystallin family protein [Kibdelosporangium lantanae]
MTLMRFDPFRDLDRFTDQMTAARAFRPMPMEAVRRGDEFLVALDLPGVDPNDVDVTVERNVVTVRATRRPMRAEEDEVIVDERPQGEFTRQLFLGDNLDPGHLAAEYDRGVLVLRIPVSEESRPRRVQIGSGDQERQAIETGARQAEPANA